MKDTFYNIHCPVFSALLTDFHNSDPLPVLHSLEKNKPKLILIAGDLIYGDIPDKSQLNIYQNGSNGLELLRGCTQIAPTFFSLGNHEWMLTAEDFAVISETGTIVLDNSWVKYKGIVIGGLSSAYYTEYQKVRKANPDKGPFPIPVKSLSKNKISPDLNWLADFEKQPGYKILLCHQPEYYPQYLRERRIDLILSGHAHGGQWRYFSLFRGDWQGIFAPGQGFFPLLTSGIHDDRLVISHGLANTTIVPRINNAEEVVYLSNNRVFVKKRIQRTSFAYA